MCCPPLAATGSSLCNPSHTSTGLLHGHQHSTATSICGSRMILKCHAGSCHRCRANGYTLALQVGDWAWSYYTQITKIQLPRNPGKGPGPKRYRTPTRNTYNLHSKHYFPEHCSPVLLCNRRNVLCVNQERGTETWVPSTQSRKLDKEMAMASPHRHFKL